MLARGFFTKMDMVHNSLAFDNVQGSANNSFILANLNMYTYIFSFVCKKRSIS